MTLYAFDHPVLFTSGVDRGLCFGSNKKLSAMLGDAFDERTTIGLMRQVVKWEVVFLFGDFV